MTQAEIARALEDAGCTIGDGSDRGVIARHGAARIHAIQTDPCGAWWLNIVAGGATGGFNVEEPEEVRDALAYMGIVEAAAAVGAIGAFLDGAAAGVAG
jgi:hypothetical protein